MARSATILVFSRDPSILILSTRLQQDGITTALATSTGEVHRAAAAELPGIAVLDGALSQDEVSEARHFLSDLHAVPALILVPQDMASHYTADQKRANSGELVGKPIKIEELTLRVKAMLIRAGFDLPSSSSYNPSSQGGGRRNGKTIAVFAAKAGTGKSTIAVNLATGLSQLYGYQTLLVDADLWFGDVGVLLNVASKRTLFDLCAGNEPDAASLQLVAARHDSGISVLLRPEDMVAAEKMSAREIERVLVLASSMFDFVIVDTHTTLDDVTLRVLDIADQILLVATPEMSAVSNTSRFLRVSEELGYQPKLSLVINRSNAGIDTKSLTRSLSIDVAATVVSAGVQVVRSANEGKSLFNTDSKESLQVTRDMAKVVELVAGSPRAEVQVADNRSVQTAEKLPLRALRRRWSW